MTDLAAFFKSTASTVASVGAIWVPINRATTWLIENDKRLEFIQAEASEYGLRCGFAEKKIDGKTFHYVKFEKANPCPKIMPSPRLSLIETEPSR